MSDRTELPVPDYDHLPEGSLEHRVRALDAAGIQQLLDYERAHGDRLRVVQMLTTRLDALHAGATPSGGDPQAAQPEHPAAPSGGSPVSTSTAQANNQPLRHGVAGQTPNRDIRGR